ncbi:hypothetical protein BD289DRAFT_433140 [Coniella lustricola]|uniref:Uncharacterized protein n=1 Tax=Coniella lustricola TaxID=2025994 RepID=A0A2T3A8Y6_9PEZI|nr:hypothetical protein BD289DRAFT_433140 [Coniella lustricola]
MQSTYKPNQTTTTSGAGSGVPTAPIAQHIHHSQDAGHRRLRADRQGPQAQEHHTPPKEPSMGILLDQDLQTQLPRPFAQSAPTRPRRRRPLCDHLILPKRRYKMGRPQHFETLYKLQAGDLAALRDLAADCPLPGQDHGSPCHIH